MPINAGAIGIQPVQPQRPTGETEGIQRRQDSTAGGFRPQTQVSLKTAITDLAATLSKISSNEKFGFTPLHRKTFEPYKSSLRKNIQLELF